MSDEEKTQKDPVQNLTVIFFFCPSLTGNAFSTQTLPFSLNLSHTNTLTHILKKQKHKNSLLQVSVPQFLKILQP